VAKIKVGDFIFQHRLKTISESEVDVPATQQVTHIQFRRFASCPICNLHISTFIDRHLELVATGIQEVVVFHSTQEEMLKHGSDVPFAMIADPTKTLYKSFGVESSVLSILNPVAWASGVTGLLKFKQFPYEKGQGLFGLPADFLITKTGEVVAVKYGVHADDHWEVDEVIQQARQLAVA
jgi:peroxiredoxin